MTISALLGKRRTAGVSSPGSSSRAAVGVVAVFVGSAVEEGGVVPPQPQTPTKSAAEIAIREEVIMARPSLHERFSEGCPPAGLYYGSYGTRKLSREALRDSVGRVAADVTGVISARRIGNDPSRRSALPNDGFMQCDHD